jgi:hypothetical protein
MKSILFFPFILLAMLFAFISKTFAQTETRTLEAFEAVNLVGSPDVTLVQGDTEKAEITAKDADVKVITEVKKGILHVSLEDVRTKEASEKKKRKYNSYNRNKVSLRITFKQLNAVEVTGSGDINIESPLKTNNLAVAVTGSGNIKTNNIEVANKLSITVTGAGNVSMGQGSANTMKANVAGSGNIQAKKITAKEANVNVAGSGNAVVCASESLNANVGGSGNIAYSGNPAKVSKNVSGSGNIRGK